jgi:hypothetical protein
VAKGKARGALEKGEGELIPAKGIAKETQRANPTIAKCLASFGVRATDIASLEIIAGTVIGERREEREGVLQYFFQARKRKPRKRLSLWWSTI